MANLAYYCRMLGHILTVALHYMGRGHAYAAFSAVNKKYRTISNRDPAICLMIPVNWRDHTRNKLALGFAKASLEKSSCFRAIKLLHLRVLTKSPGQARR
jgi:hypothetical protein